MFDITKYAPAIKETVSGETVMCKNVSPLKHNLDIELISDTITDFSGVKVSRYGKNLFDINSSSIKGVTAGSFGEIKNNQLIVSHTGKGTYKHAKVVIDFPDSTINKAVTISSKVQKSSSVNNVYIRLLKIAANGTDVKEVLVTTSLTTKTEGSVFGTAILPEREEGEQYQIWFYVHTSGTLEANTTYNAIYSDIQIEIGSITTTYEPYKEPQTATANTDGTVEGLRSVSPNMTLLADNNVIIDCTYNKSTKAYIDEKVSALSAALLEV